MMKRIFFQYGLLAITLTLMDFFIALALISLLIILGTQTSFKLQISLFFIAISLLAFNMSFFATKKSFYEEFCESTREVCRKSSSDPYIPYIYTSFFHFVFHCGVGVIVFAFSGLEYKLPFALHLLGTSIFVFVSMFSILSLYQSNAAASREKSVVSVIAEFSETDNNFLYQQQLVQAERLKNLELNPAEFKNDKNLARIFGAKNY